jgi:hypothetical protein
VWFSLLERIAKYLRKYPLWMIAAGVAICTTPGLFLGFVIDDYLALIRLTQRVPTDAPLDIFLFAPGDAQKLEALVAHVPFPWYTLPELKFHFFRPLSSWLMALDVRWFGDWAFAYHLHSLVWYLVCLCVVGILLTSMLPRDLAWMAVLLFAIDEGHALPALWWSNRNALVAAVPALFGLLAHWKWREEHWKPGLPLSLLGYGIGFLGAESALGVLGYVAAYEFFYDRAPWHRRLVALIPAGLLTSAFLIFYKVGGYGAYGSSLYVDPFAEWDAFLSAAPVKFVLLFAAQFINLPTEPITVFPKLVYVFFGLGLVTAALIGYAFFQSFRRASLNTQRSLRWLTLGSALSTLPILATMPENRVLLLPSIGGAVVLALLIHEGSVRKHLRLAARTPASIPVMPALVPRSEKPLGFLGNLGLGTLVTIHVLFAPFAWWGMVGLMKRVDSECLRIAQESEFVDDSGAKPCTALVLNAMDPATAEYPIILRIFLGLPNPTQTYGFSFVPREIRLTRLADDALRITAPSDDPFVSREVEQLFRSRRHPLRPGDECRWPRLRVVVDEVKERGVVALTCFTEESLDSPGYRLLIVQDKRYIRIAPPAVGDSLTLPAPAQGFGKWLLPIAARGGDATTGTR